MSRLMVLCICSLLVKDSFGQQGAVLSKDELIALASDKMQAYFDWASKAVDKYAVAAKAEIWSMDDQRETPYVGTQIMIQYSKRRGQNVDRYAATGSHSVELYPRWEEFLRLDNRVMRRSGQRRFEIEAYSSQKDYKLTDDTGNPILPSPFYDFSIYPVTTKARAQSHRANLPVAMEMFLNKGELFNAERLADGSVVAHIGFRNQNVSVASILFDRDSGFMPAKLSCRFAVDDEKPAFEDVLASGRLEYTTTTQWKQANADWLPKAIEMQFNSQFANHRIGEVGYSFTWCLAEEVDFSGITHETKDWMRPFYGKLIMEDYSLVEW